MKILIVGCGYLGREIAKLGLSASHEVWGLRRNVEALQDLESKGLHVISASLMSPESLRNLPAVDLVITSQAPDREMDNYEDTYLGGTTNLIAALKNKKPKRLIHISSTSVYGNHNGDWVDENDDASKDSHEDAESRENAQILLKTEEVVKNSGIGFNILRLGGLYGPGRHRLRAIKEGKIAPTFSATYVNRIRVEDAASAVFWIYDKGKMGELYLGVDDTPSTQKEFYEWLLEKLSIPKEKMQSPTTGGHVHGSNKRCLNRKMKSLGFKFQYPNFKEGYASLLKEVE